MFLQSDYNLYHAILKINELEKQIEAMGEKTIRKSIETKETEN